MRSQLCCRDAKLRRRAPPIRNTLRGNTNNLREYNDKSKSYFTCMQTGFTELGVRNAKCIRSIVFIFGVIKLLRF